jgi:hypothetical protein
VPPLHGSFNGRRRKVLSRARVRCAFIEANAETLDGFFRLCQARCLKRGHLTKEENWSSSLLLYALTRVRDGRCGEGTAPLRWVVEDDGTIGGCKQGGDFRAT